MTILGPVKHCDKLPSGFPPGNVMSLKVEVNPLINARSEGRWTIAVTGPNPEFELQWGAASETSRTLTEQDTRLVTNSVTMDLWFETDSVDESTSHSESLSVKEAMSKFQS